MPDAQSHPQPRVQDKKAHERSHHRYTAINRHSLRDGFTAYSALSPVIGLSCHRRFADTSAKLDAGVEASGPHDFAVRARLRKSHSMGLVPVPPKL
jgi:hypothetical protein